MKLKLLLCLSLIISGIANVRAQNAISTKQNSEPAVKWTVKNPFEQKVLIENKGQYSLPGKAKSKDILFGARQGGLEYYFTNHSILIKRNVSVKRTAEEMEEVKAPTDKNGVEEKEEKELQYKTVEEFHQVEFSNSSSSATITGENKVSWYYTYGNTKNTTIKAQAFKKLTYHNLYKGIDMEFYLPDGAKGYEYSFIVHPGADLSQIKIQYPLNKGVQVDGQGNLKITSSYGYFTESIPNTSQENKTIGNSFLWNGTSLQFNVSGYDKTKGLLIDPLTITPTFTGANDAYDVDWDNDGNCYAYGGSTPWQLVKYNSNGTLLWSYTETFPYTSTIYGGFATDRISQSVYIVEGYDVTYGAQVVKLNSAGGVAANFTGNVDMNEMYRVKFSQCSHEAVIAAGGTCCANQSCFLDTTLGTLTPVNSLSASDGYHDMWGVALDNNGYAYLAVAQPVYGTPSEFNNVMVKVPMPSLAPYVWEVSDNYRFQEVSSVDYNKSSYAPNGFNGITVSDSELYTYDSYTLKKWSTNTGKLKDSAVVNIAVDDSLMHWAGLSSNDCDNVFAGSQTSVIQFNSALSQVNSFSMPDTVYCVSLGNDNILYASGVDFISALQISLPSCNAVISSYNNSVTAPSCSLGGSVTVTPVGGTAPYSISWNTIPAQAGPTATNLAPGVYIATISDFSCSGQSTVYDTVNVPAHGRDSVTVNNATVCSGNSVTLSAAGAATYSWSPATGLSATTGSSVTANPTANTTYMLIGSGGSGCTDTVYAVVTVGTLPAIPTITISGDTLTSSSAANNQWYHNGSLVTGATGQTYITHGAGGTFYVVVTNPESGCNSASASTSGIGLLSANNEQLSIYPNPTNGEINILCSDIITDIKVTNVLGQLIYESQPKQNQLTFELNTTGLYFVTVISNNKTTTTKIVVSR